MSNPEVKIKIPDGMLDAASHAMNQYHESGHFQSMDWWAKIALEAALRWLSNNRTMPDEKQVDDLLDDSLQYWHYGDHALRKETVLSIHTRLNALWDEFQRTMFLAPKPEVPEAIKDMIFTTDGQLTMTPKEHNDGILEAYRRGQQSAKTTQPPEYKFGMTGFKEIVPEMDRVDYYRSIPGGSYSKIDGPVDVKPKLTESERLSIDLLTDGRKGALEYHSFQEIAEKAFLAGKNSATQQGIGE